MPDFNFCDICGRSQEDFVQETRDTSIKFYRDEDDFWVCSECQSNLISLPTTQEDGEDLDERIKGLIGKSVGAICRTTNLPFVPPYQSIIEAASRIAYDEDRYMSAWSFVTQWMDGTTVWQSVDKSAKALVDTKGDIRIESIE